MAKICILGAGMVGRAMAIDLANSHEVCSADFSQSALDLLKETNIKTQILDVKDKAALKAFVADYDLVVGAVPGYLGFETLRSVIEAGKNCVDISFFPEDAFLLNDLAKENGVIAIVDCGVAPGMGNIILGYHDKQMKVHNFECYVGGLPFERKYPFQYKAPFSPIDVLEEYTRPARLKENGVIVTKAALSEAEYMNFDGIGTLEAFNTDGLRSLLKTMVHIPNLKEKTLRYPGHIEYIKILKDMGFLSDEEMNVNGKSIRPIELTSQILFKDWKLEEDDEEFTVMRIKVDGTLDKEELSYEYFLYDIYDHETKTSSMARTTGYTATAAVELILNGKFDRIGVNPPEFIGAEEDCLEFIFQYLIERGVFYEEIMN